MEPPFDDRALRDIIIGESPTIREVRALIQRAASQDTTVCVEGETGTGKELVARALHFTGPRREAPFIALDCATSFGDGGDQSDVHLTLFGFVKGALTGALDAREGAVEQAGAGALFLNRVSELAPHWQAKLLRS